MTFWPNINWWVRYRDGLSVCQVWRFYFQPFRFVPIVRTNRHTTEIQMRMIAILTRLPLASVNSSKQTNNRVREIRKKFVKAEKERRTVKPGFHSNAISCVGKQPIMVATASTEHSYWLTLAFVAWNFHATQRKRQPIGMLGPLASRRKRLRLNGNRALDL